MYEREFLVVDFEFTTYNKPFGRPRAFFSEVIECGAVLVSSPDFLPQRRFQSFVQPRFFPKLASDSQQFAMITQADLDAGRSFEEMVEELAKLYRPGITHLVAWGDADWEVLSTACARYGVNNPFSFDDYIDLAREYRLARGYDRTPSLKTAMEENLLMPSGFLHTALEDASGTAKLLGLMIASGWQPSKR